MVSSYYMTCSCRRGVDCSKPAFKKASANKSKKEPPNPQITKEIHFDPNKSNILSLTRICFGRICVGPFFTIVDFLSSEPLQSVIN